MGGHEVLSTVQAFDGSKWTELTEGLKTAVVGASSLVLNNKAYVVGGRGNSGILSTVQAFDGNKWAELTGDKDLKIAVESASSFVLNNKAYVVGGMAIQAFYPPYKRLTATSGQSLQVIKP